MVAEGGFRTPDRGAAHDCGFDLARKPVRSKRGELAPRLAMVFAAILMGVAFFLPYVSVNPELRSALEAASALSVSSDALSDDVADASLFYLVRLALSLGDASAAFSAESLGPMAVLIAAIYALPLVFALSCLLFGIAKFPVPGIAFAVLSLGVQLFIWNAMNSEAASGDSYVFGIAPWIGFAATAAYVAAAIWDFIVKRKNKRAWKASQAPSLSASMPTAMQPMLPLQEPHRPRGAHAATTHDSSGSNDLR